MCGRCTLVIEGSMIADWFDFDHSGLELEPQCNTSPINWVLAVTSDGESNRWQLITWFSKEPRPKYNTIKPPG